MNFQNRYKYSPKNDLLGKGGFARVYKANDVLLDREVAVKVFSVQDGEHYTVLEEIKKVIKYEHPNLLRYYDVAILENTNAFGETEELQVGIMEYANAGDLKTFAQKNPGSPLLFKFLQQVLQGLAFLHQNGIIHRDLKPQNILLTEKNGELTAKISDFGISKNMDTGTNSASVAIGTIEYMAPEQFSPNKYGIGGKISTNLDLWSFGIMVHELITDRPPFGQRSGSITAEQIMNSILSAELPTDIEKLKDPYKAIIKKCLVADAKLRIRSATELISYFEVKQDTEAKNELETQVLSNYANQSAAQKAEELIAILRREKTADTKYDDKMHDGLGEPESTKIFNKGVKITDDTDSFERIISVPEGYRQGSAADFYGFIAQVRTKAEKEKKHINTNVIFFNKKLVIWNYNFETLDFELKADYKNRYKEETNILAVDTNASFCEYHDFMHETANLPLYFRGILRIEQAALFSLESTSYKQIILVNNVVGTDIAFTRAKVDQHIHEVLNIQFFNKNDLSISEIHNIINGDFYAGSDTEYSVYNLVGSRVNYLDKYPIIPFESLFKGLENCLDAIGGSLKYRDSIHIGVVYPEIDVFLNRERIINTEAGVSYQDRSGVLNINFGQTNEIEISASYKNKRDTIFKKKLDEADFDDIPFRYPEIKNGDFVNVYNFEQALLKSIPVKVTDVAENGEYIQVAELGLAYMPKNNVKLVGPNNIEIENKIKAIKFLLIVSSFDNQLFFCLSDKFKFECFI